MYKDFQEAAYLPLQVTCDSLQVPHEKGKTRPVPRVSASAAQAVDGSTIISLANISLDTPCEVEFNLNDNKPKAVTGTLLTCKNINDYNSFEHPNTVQPIAFKGAKISKNTLRVKLPAKSIAVLKLNQ